MASEPTKLLWCDIETTGLEKDAFLLEVATFVTECDGTNVVHPGEWIIKPQDPNWKESMVPFVKEMHTKSGLLQVIEWGGTDILTFYTKFTHYLERLVEENDGKQLTMAGSGVGPFDLPFLKARIPAVEECLTYYVMDVGVIGRFLRNCLGIELPERPEVLHRVDNPIQDHYAEFIQYKQLLRMQ